MIFLRHVSLPICHTGWRITVTIPIYPICPGSFGVYIRVYLCSRFSVTTIHGVPKSHLSYVDGNCLSFPMYLFIHNDLQETIREVVPWVEVFWHGKSSGLIHRVSSSNRYVSSLRRRVESKLPKRLLADETSVLLVSDEGVEG